MEDKNIIYNKTNDNITPIDTSAKDFATTLGIPYQTYLNYENKGT